MAAKKTMLASLWAETQPHISCVPSILATMRRRTRSGLAPCSRQSAQMRGLAGQSVPQKMGITRTVVLLRFPCSGLLKDVIWLSWRTRTVLLQFLSRVLALTLACSCGKPVQGPTITISHFWKRKHLSSLLAITDWIPWPVEFAKCLDWHMGEDGNPWPRVRGALSPPPAATGCDHQQYHNFCGNSELRWRDSEHGQKQSTQGTTGKSSNFLLVILLHITHTKPHK